MVASANSFSAQNPCMHVDKTDRRGLFFWIFLGEKRKLSCPVHACGGIWQPES